MASSLSSNTVSATLIIRTSFIWNLNYLDTRKYMTMHTRTEGMANDLYGYGYRLSNELQAIYRLALAKT